MEILPQKCGNVVEMLWKSVEIDFHKKLGASKILGKHFQENRSIKSAVHVWGYGMRYFSPGFGSMCSSLLRSADRIFGSVKNLWKSESVEK